MYHKESVAIDSQPNSTLTADSSQYISTAQIKPNYILGMLPAFGYVRLAQLIPDPTQKDRPGVVPVSGATIWRWVKSGQFPPPVKLSDRVTAWRVDDIKKWIWDRGT